MPFEDAGEFHSLDTANDGSVKGLSSEAESNESYAYHVVPFRMALSSFQELS
jgi:hypothetical protein